MERVTEKVRNPGRREDMIQDIESGEEFTPAEAALLFPPREEPGVRGTKFKGIYLTTHAQYRMDLRGIALHDVERALFDFHQTWSREKSKNSFIYQEMQSDLEWGRKVKWQDRLGLTVVFQPSSKQRGFVVSVITAYWTGDPTPRPQAREQCEQFTGWADQMVPRVAARYQEAGLRDVWLQWIVQPFHVIWKHHKEFVTGPVDDAMDAIIKDLAPALVKAIVEEEVDADVDEFLEGAVQGKWDSQQGLFFDPEANQTSDWSEGYDWGFHNPAAVKAGLPPQLKKRLVEEGVREVRQRITEEVVRRALEKSWHAISPLSTFRAIMVAVKKHGWKLGVGFALFEMFEHFVVPAALVALTGDKSYLALASVPIGEVVYAVVFRLLGRTPAEADKANPDGHLDWFEDQYGPVRIAARGGDCYEANGRYFLENANDGSRLKLVQGEVTGQGALEGVKFGHCWVEDGNVVVDVSNGRHLRIPKPVYYAMGKVGSNVHRYSFEEFREKISEHGHWGPWDLRTSTGF
jgi:hypothetical protein